MQEIKAYHYAAVSQAFHIFSLDLDCDCRLQLNRDSVQKYLDLDLDCDCRLQLTRDSVQKRLEH